MDTGAETVLLTEDHRVATHQGERRRLDAMGATIAPIDISGATQWAFASHCDMGWVGSIKHEPAHAASDAAGSCHQPSDLRHLLAHPRATLLPVSMVSQVFVEGCQMRTSATVRIVPFCLPSTLQDVALAATSPSLNDEAIARVWLPNATASCCAGSGPAKKDPYRKGVSLGVGPLRLWPGGLCLSRAIGDFDVGDAVLSLPYICQVLLLQPLRDLSPRSMPLAAFPGQELPLVWKPHSDMNVRLMVA